MSVKGTSPAKKPAARAAGEGTTKRGAALVEEAIAVGRERGVLRALSPVPSEVLARLALPNGEPLPASLRALLAVDGGWLGLGIDLEDAELEVLDLEDLIAEELGEDAAPRFAEAYELLSDDCLRVGERGKVIHVLYVGNPDDAGEYPVIGVEVDPAPRVFGFVPFDVWVAIQLGALGAGEGGAGVPASYASSVKTLARRNGDGRTSFTPEAEDETED